MDHLTVERRSENMRRIRSSDTTPEVAVRRMLHRLGYRFRLHGRNLPGRPDIVLARWKTVVFVHGCFWHCHTCKKGNRRPKSNLSYWNSKLGRVLNSKNFGVPQSRQRVFIVGTYREGQGPAEILFEPERRQRNDEASRSNGQKPLSPFKASVGDTRKGPIVKALAHCLYACSARHTGTDWSRNYASYPDGRVRRFVPVECERLQGFPDGWTMPENARYKDSDDIDSMRYHALGNAVTMPVAEWLAARIKAFLAATAKRTR